MRISTTDPITGHDVPPPLDTHPFIVEGDGEEALKIYFENEESKHIYEDIEVEHPGDDFEYNLNNPG
ncbi:MAG: hypothetical protein BMS9Abin15_1215 [Gammaproteobacteria bacterium]|nr:MAG: hypothetical protein BMS9Abin15_1215 [Gammaproteobacteria bacterium]